MVSSFALGALALATVVVLGACVDLAVAPIGTAAPTNPAAPTGTAATAAPTDAALPTATAAPTPAAPDPTDTPEPTQGQQPEGNLCDIVTIAEVSAAAGGAPVVLSEDHDQPGVCTWDVGEPDESTLPDAWLDLRLELGAELEEAQILWTGSESVPIGDEGYWLAEFSVAWFVRGGTTYAVQVIALDDDAVDERALALGVAAVAASRL